MSTVVRIGKIGCLALVMLALLVLPVGGQEQEKVIDFGGGEKAAEPKPGEPKAGEVAAEQPEAGAAETLLDQLAKEEKWRRERATFLAEHYTQSGIARYGELEYELANVRIGVPLAVDCQRTGNARIDA